jgi:hypothetical protein
MKFRNVKRLDSQTLEFGDFTDSTTTGTIEFDHVLPAGAMPIGSLCDVSVGFTGATSGVATTQVGIAGDIDRFSSVTDQSVYASSTKVGSGVPADACDGMNAVSTPIVTVTTDDFTNVTAGTMVASIFYIDTKEA